MHNAVWDPWFFFFYTHFFVVVAIVACCYWQLCWNVQLHNEGTRDLRMTHLWETLLVNMVHHDDLIVKWAVCSARAAERRERGRAGGVKCGRTEEDVGSSKRSPPSRWSLFLCSFLTPQLTDLVTSETLSWALSVSLSDFSLPKMYSPCCFSYKHLRLKSKRTNMFNRGKKCNVNLERNSCLNKFCTNKCLSAWRGIWREKRQRMEGLDEDNPGKLIKQGKEWLTWNGRTWLAYVKAIAMLWDKCQHSPADPLKSHRIRHL